MEVPAHIKELIQAIASDCTFCTDVLAVESALSRFYVSMHFDHDHNGRIERIAIGAFPESEERAARCRKAIVSFAKEGYMDQKDDDELMAELSRNASHYAAEALSLLRLADRRMGLLKQCHEVLDGLKLTKDHPPSMARVMSELRVALREEIFREND